MPPAPLLPGSLPPRRVAEAEGVTSPPPPPPAPAPPEGVKGGCDEEEEEEREGRPGVVVRTGMGGEERRVEESPPMGSASSARAALGVRGRIRVACRRSNIPLSVACVVGGRVMIRST